MVKHWRLLLGVAALAMARESAPGDAMIPSGVETAIVDVTVIPMDRERAVPHQTVLVHDGRIVAVGPGDSLTVPPETRRIQGAGRFLIPGLADMHVHVWDTTDFTLDLAQGVTTIRNLEGLPIHLRWRAKVDSGVLLGPTIFTSGPFTNQPTITTPRDAREAVLAQQASGYDEIKIHGALSRDAYDTLTAVARRVGIPVVGHAPRNLPFEAVLEDGQAELSHVEELIYTFFHYDVSAASAERIPEVVAAIRRAGLVITPTLVTYRRIAAQVENLDSLLADPAMAYVRPYELATWQRENNRYLRGGTGPERIGTLRARYAFQVRLVQALHAAGVPLMMGTDAVGPTWVPGWAAHEELEIFVGLGMTPYQALRTATHAPAAFLGQAGLFGVIAPGARADLVLLEANPLDEIRNTRRIAGVMVRGRWLPKAALAARLADVARANDRERAEVAAIAKRGLLASATLPCDTGAALSDDARQLAQLGVVNDFARELRTRGLAAARELVDSVRARCPTAVLLSEPRVNAAADSLRARGDTAGALRILEFNAEAFPRSFLAPYWLAEAYLAAGDTARAVVQYRHSVANDPGMMDAIDRLRQLAAKP
jgi:imidazolonepropionase-like amidohydrolase